MVLSLFEDSIAGLVSVPNPVVACLPFALSVAYGLILRKNSLAISLVKCTFQFEESPILLVQNRPESMLHYIPMAINNEQ